MSIKNTKPVKPVVVEAVVVEEVKTPSPVVEEVKTPSPVEEAIAKLTALGLGTGDLEKLLREVGVIAPKPAITKELTFPEVIAYLGEEPRTEKEFYEYVLKYGTRNEARWINDRNVVRRTTNQVFAKFGKTIVEVAATKELKDSLKAKAAASK